MAVSKFCYLSVYSSIFFSVDVTRELRLWTKKYMIVLEYWKSLEHSRRDSRTKVIYSIFTCSFSYSLTFFFKIKKSFSSYSPFISFLDSYSLWTEEFFYVIFVQSNFIEISFFLLTTLFFFISFIKSYSKSFYFFKTAPFDVISYS